MSAFLEALKTLAAQLQPVLQKLGLKRAEDAGKAAADKVNTLEDAEKEFKK